MNSERWQRVQILVEEALSRPAEARRAFVDSACGRDPELCAEVVSLLAACERGPDSPGPPASWFGLLAGPEPARFGEGDQVAHRYRVQRLLGRGGMGEVYEAWDEELSIPVALKTLHLPGSTEDAHKRLKLEGLLARSVWHPNVCRLYDLGRHGEGADAAWFLTMELLRGETLSKRLQDEGKLPPDRALRLAEQMAAGLGAAHQAGVVHRDFKPGNIMLVTRDGDEQAVVTDFGLAREAPQSESREDPKRASGLIVGTPAYMAPEQVLGDEVGPAADLYALGVVIFEMVTGTLPFTGDSPMDVAQRRLTEDAPSPRTVVPELDERWETVILRCLSREPTRRFGRAEEVVEVLAGRTSVGQTESLDHTVGVAHMLPAERDPFVGRTMESQDLERNLAGGSRLVTLVGAGGMGKTRLAIHYGSRRLNAWPGGVWFCDLTEARGLEGIASSLAASLGIQLGRGDPIVQLGHAIAGRGRSLIILDNFEQVVAHAAATVGRWLARAGEAHFLVTSREKLGLDEQERVQAVGPLSIEAGMDLLAGRVRRLCPGIDLLGSEANSAREIVRLVDGMPLAIELAAARMRVMSADQIVAQMRKRFSLLTGGGSARHETLVITLDGSWELLKPWEQSAWAQCSVFEGGFTLEAAEGVVDLGAWPESPWLVDVLQSLVDKSLLRTWRPTTRLGEGVPEARFGMFVSLQEYARMKLHDEGPAAVTGSDARAERAAETRHGQWYARYNVEAPKGAGRREAVKQWRRLEREIDNLMGACRRAMARGDGEVAAATYRASWEVLNSRGPVGAAVDLGREALRELRLGRAEEADVLRMLGIAEWYSGMMEESRAHTESALDLARELGDRRLESVLLCNLGGLQIDQGRVGEANAYAEMALAAARELVDLRLEVGPLSNLSMIRYQQGRMEEALTLAEMALAAARLAGEWRGEGTILGNLGVLHQELGHAEQARTHHEEALAFHRETGNRRSEGIARGNLGGLRFDQGEIEEARANYEAALGIHRELGQRLSEGIVLRDLGALHAAQKRVGEARAHYEAALAIHRELGNRRQEANLFADLGKVHQDQGEMEEAHSHYEAALAIQREVGDRRSEGVTLTRLAGLLQHQGSREAARNALANGERFLREVSARLELGELLCMRAGFEQAAGNLEAATATLGEAEAIATEFGSGPHSELGRLLTDLRRTLAASDLPR